MENIWMTTKATTDGFFGFWTMLSAGIPIAIGLMFVSFFITIWLVVVHRWPVSVNELAEAFFATTLTHGAIATANLLISSLLTAESASETKELYVITTLFAAVLTAFWAGSIVGIIVGFVSNRRRAGVTQ